MIRLFNKYKELIMYLIFGVLTTLVSLVSYYLLTVFLLRPNVPFELQCANIISWVISVLFAYITNKKYVFESKKNSFKEFINFVFARIITLVMDMLIMGIGVSLMNFSDKIIKIISQVIVIVANYLFSKIFVFKKNTSITLEKTK